ncbi:MAG: class I SAM-dependent methyltransferase, partial [Planctomycetia bacterium]
MSDETKERVRAQFGAAAGAYATCSHFAAGETLAALLDLLPAGPYRRVLDVGCGAGHTALAFAPRAAAVVAADYTPAMLDQCRRLAAERGLTNVFTDAVDAENLPYENGSFDLVLCRLAMHHFPNPEKAAAEFHRVLEPGGRLGFTDNFTVADLTSAAVYNDFERKRDPSHHRVVSLEELKDRFESVGFVVEEQHLFRKEFEFQE